MVRSRKRNCTHYDRNVLFVAVSDNDDRSTPDKVGPPLQRLADLLNSLPSPLDGALVDVTGPDVGILLARASIKQRQHALSALGLRLTPRTISQALGHDVAQRLTRVHVLDARHAAQILTWPVYAGFLNAIEIDAEANHIDPGEVWAESLLRLALWCGVDASMEGARILLWAGTQSWWLPQGLSDEHGAAVLNAAQTVVNATVNASPAPNSQHARQHPDTYNRTHAPLPTGESAEDGPNTDFEDTDGDDDCNVGRAYEQFSSEGLQGSVVDTVVLSILRADRTELETVRQTAREAVASAADALDVGDQVSTSTVDALTRYTTLLDSLAQRLSKQAGTTQANVRDIDAALERLAQILDKTSALARLDVLRRLRTTPGSVTLDVQLATLADVVESVTTSKVPDDTVVAALIALCELIEIIADSGPTDTDPQRLLELQTQAAGGLPRDLAALPIAVITGQIQAGPSSTSAADDSHTSSVAAPSDVDSEPDTTTGKEDPGRIRSPIDIDVDRQESISAPPLSPSDETSAAACAPLPDLTDEIHSKITSQKEDKDDVNKTVAGLVIERRFGLASQITNLAGWSPIYTSVLQMVALAEAVRGDTGPCAVRLRAELASIDADEIAAEPETQYLALPALIRVALVTGEPTAGALLTALAPHLEAHLGTMAEHVGQRTLKGVLVGNSLRTMLADVGELERQLQMTRTAAQDRLRPRSLRFRRATNILRSWLDRNGMLGTLLVAAAEDARDRIAEVNAEVRRLSNNSELIKELDQADKDFRGSSGRPLEGAARHDLLALASDAVTAVSMWLDSAAALQAATNSGRTWATAELTDVRNTVLTNVRPATEALTEHAQRSVGFVKATAIAACHGLAQTAELLEGRTGLAPGEPPADQVLTVELLKVVGATIDKSTGKVSLPPGVGLRGLLNTANATWSDAFVAQVKAEQYPAAHHLLTLSENASVSQSSIALPDRARTILQTAEQSSRDQLYKLRGHLVNELSRARLEQEVNEEQYGELSALLNDANPERTDLAVVRDHLQKGGSLLPQYRQEAAQRLRRRLEALLAKPQPGVEIDEKRIRQLIDNGKMSTAEELLYFCEIGEPVPQSRGRNDLAQFFPAVPDFLSDGITDAVVRTVRTGGVVEGCATLDYTKLSHDAREVTANALEAWRLAGSTPPSGRTRLDARDNLIPPLRLAGYDFNSSSIARDLPLPRGPERRFVEFTEVRWNGRAMVPQFGSRLAGRLRVLLCWGQPAEDLLMSWVDQDTSGDTILVAYFGTMSAETRQRLAIRATETDAPVAVLDDAALAYLAAHGDRQLQAAMSVLLPFSAVQPFVRRKRSLVASEMFYGRDHERKEVLDPEGTQVIFGGRGLGKSALLRDAKAAFERETGRVAIHIELNTVDIGPGRQGADAVWDVLLRELEAVDVVTPRPRKTTRLNRSSYETVRAGVLDWLATDSRRRLLVLLDESDGFFEADAPRFLETNRLKDLGQAPGVEGRAKVVFAGLHSVQRFAKVSNNTFKHLAQRPTGIGPLRPQSAYNLISRPAQTLGLTFEDEDLVHRILGYCSYQPFLLQIFGHRLVQHMHDKRKAGIRSGQSSFVITGADIDAVENDPDLKADITSTFHDTLHLDPRYNVIANVLAHHAYEHGMDLRLTETELKEECRAYWPSGFTSLDAEAFRAYLHEMVQLGVLASNADLRGWRLRSANVLRMIGTPDQVTTQLVDAQSTSVPSEFIALTVRRSLPNGRRAPLTAAQIDDLLGDRANQVRLVLGSKATGIEDVATTIKAVCDDLGGRYELIETGRRRQFEDALPEGKPGQRRIILSDLATLAPKIETCSESLETALRHRPTKPGITRSVVLVSNTDQIAFWQEAVAKPDRPGLGIVTLRRHDTISLRVWSLDTGRFAHDDRRRRLLEVTGGWPLLVEQAADLAAGLDSEDAALTKLADSLKRPTGIANLIDAVGLAADHTVAAAFDGLIQLIDSNTRRAELVEAVGVTGTHPDPHIAVTTLEALGVFTVDDAGGYTLEPVIRRCWLARQ